MIRSSRNAVELYFEEIILGTLKQRYDEMDALRKWFLSRVSQALISRQLAKARATWGGPSSDGRSR